MIKLNNVELNFERYPNGELRVDGEQIHSLKKDLNQIAFKYESDDDLLKLLFVKSCLDEDRLSTSLLIYYMPYSRMDRVESGSVFTLKYICKMINTMNFSSVVVIEPHSDVTPALLDRCVTLFPTIGLLGQVMDEIGFDKKMDYLFFPDTGAAKRYGKDMSYNQLVGYKIRDFATGEITRLDVLGDIKGKGFKVIIMDDLCSFGGTFIRSAEKLKSLGASEVYLLVAHCESSIFKGEIFKNDLITRVYTTNSIISSSSVDIEGMGIDCRERLKIFDIEEICFNKTE